ncbi:MAG: CopG family ribbon-helix-helix protein [Candidatus Poseidoniales archaeon]|jgi:metal-responsive CopG/Arc/MetJ family transcriptional regulator|tara:strand:+ start:502 stop:927 length:426 start_codon:yes stop_codon:yes gene_type:complete
MSRILSFSTDNEFAEQLERLIIDSGYKNRSMFLRDASLHFAEAKRRGDLETMDDDTVLEGTIVIYYQHGVENKLMELRHSHEIDVFSFHHNCLTDSHSCVDTMQVRGNATSFRKAIDKLNNTQDIDKVEFVAAPMREHGCC